MYKAKCINKSGWRYECSKITRWFLIKFGKGVENYGPKYGDIVHVTGEETAKGLHYFHLQEYPEDAFRSDQFVPYDESTDSAVDEVNKILHSGKLVVHE